MHAPTLRTIQPLLNPTEAWWAGVSPRDDRSAVSLLQMESAGGRHQRTVYELFGEMEEKDGHLYSILQTRLNGLLGLPRRVVPAAPANGAAREAADVVARLLDAIPRQEELLRALLEGIARGFAVVELVWDYDAAGRLSVVDWIAHPQEWFHLGGAGGLSLLSPPFRASSESGDAPMPGPGRAAESPTRAFAPPPRKFILFRFGADARNPYGRGLCQRAYWYYWFKKNALKFWAVFNERYGSPTAIATYGPGTTAEERRTLRDILEALQTESGVVLPESVNIRLLEQARGNGTQSYQAFLDWCNDEMSKIVLGATLTSGEGRRSGSLALGGIHQLVRQDYIDADAGLLSRLLDDTLVRWLCELNLGPAAPRPLLRIETESPEDLNARIEVDRALLSLGVALPQGYFYERYGRPAPAGEEAPLRFDDANFYQYHLQFGILTVNEVRARLGLAPVAWGDARTADPGVDVPKGSASPEDRGVAPG